MTVTNYIQFFIMNPFPNPETVSHDLNKQTTDFIRAEFKKRGTIQFFDFLSYISAALQDGNHDLAKIIAYYACNTVINNPEIPYDKKKALIDDISREVISHGPSQDQESS